MCSHTCNSACACGTGGNLVSSIWNSGLKKQQKRPRVPKRGPGVAELEKILREQGTVDITDKENPEGFPSFISHHLNSNSYPSSSLKFHPTPPSTSPKTTLPSSPVSSNLPVKIPYTVFDHLSSSALSNISSVCGKGSLERSTGSGLVSAEKDLFPLSLNSCKSKSSNMNEQIDGNGHEYVSSPSRNLSNDYNSIWPSSARIQNRNSQYSPTMNQLRGTSSSSASLSAGLHNQQELPSNQNSYYNCTSGVLEEHKKKPLHISIGHYGFSFLLGFASNNDAQRAEFLHLLHMISEHCTLY
ncbi:hypothetical protein CR513_39261, partial [Mucuna pruriens]